MPLSCSCVICIYCCDVCLSFPIPPHNYHMNNNINIEQPTQLPPTTTTNTTLALSILPFKSLLANKPIANILSSADTTLSSPQQGAQYHHRHHHQRMMTATSYMPSPASIMSSNLYSRSRNTIHSSRPQRPGPSRPPQPRDGDTRHMFGALNSNSFAAKPKPGDPQPRDPGNGRLRHGPQPRDPGGKRDPPQPRDPGM